MFQGRPAAIILIKRDALVAYGGKGGTAQLDLTADLVRHLEVVDPRTLASKVAQFASEQKLRKKVVLLVLDDSVIFQKTAPLAENTDVAKIRQSFDAILPFEAADHRVLLLQPKGHVVLIGTTSVLYKLVMLGLATADVRVSAVVPLSVYGKLKGNLTQQQVTEIIHNTRLADRANFLDLEAQQ
jgi:hypothetical protein